MARSLLFSLKQRKYLELSDDKPREKEGFLCNINPNQFCLVRNMIPPERAHYL